jgi:hypothetical protein
MTFRQSYQDLDEMNGLSCQSPLYDRSSLRANFSDKRQLFHIPHCSMAVVFVAQGWLRGKAVTTESGVTYYSFQGIPYAKPPVGALRFQVRRPHFSHMYIETTLSVRPSPGIRRFFVDIIIRRACTFIEEIRFKLRNRPIPL